jgi:hypothetical protein
MPADSRQISGPSHKINAWAADPRLKHTGTCPPGRAGDYRHLKRRLLDGMVTVTSIAARMGVIQLFKRPNLPSQMQQRSLSYMT